MNWKKCLIFVVLVLAASLFAAACAAVMNSNPTLDGLWTDPGFLGLMGFGLIMFAASLKVSLQRRWVWITTAVTTSFIFLIILMLIDMSLAEIGWFGVVSCTGVFTMFTMIGMLRVIEVFMTAVHKLSFRIQNIGHPASSL